VTKCKLSSRKASISRSQLVDLAASSCILFGIDLMARRRVRYRALTSPEIEPSRFGNASSSTTASRQGWSLRFFQA
jgi:hypothetical protein